MAIIITINFYGIVTIFFVFFFTFKYSDAVFNVHKRLAATTLTAVELKEKKALLTFGGNRERKVGSFVVQSNADEKVCIFLTVPYFAVTNYCCGSSRLNTAAASE